MKRLTEKINTTKYGLDYNEEYNEEYEKGLIKTLIIDCIHKHPNSNDFELTLLDPLTHESYIVKLTDYGKLGH